MPNDTFIEELTHALCDLQDGNSSVRDVMDMVEPLIHERDDARAAIVAVAKAEARILELERTLDAVNDIRNSIVGLQRINWSEHIYPLVGALDAAGIAGMGYPEAREHYGTMLERTNAAENRVRDLDSAIEALHRQANPVPH